MKKLTILSILVLSVFFVEAQTPKDGAVLQLDAYTIDVQQGESSTKGIMIVRSKRFNKVKFDTPAIASTVEGLEVSIVPLANADQYRMTIKAGENANLGSQNLVIEMPGKWSYKVPSVLLNVNVQSTDAILSSKN